MVAHWAQYANDEYIPFIDEAEPDLVQLGFYGAHFWSLAHTPQYKGYPAHLPAQGFDECGAWFQEKNAYLRKKNIKVIGHFNVEFLVGDPESPDGPRGFFKFYRDLWDERKLGPKPVDDPTNFLERGPDGQFIVNNSYSIGGMKEYWACLRNPNWQKVLKAWVKHGIDRGLDGFIANYFYKHNCHCEHCQSGFRSYLSSRFQPDEMSKQFGIQDLKTHQFDEMAYWHKPEESTPLRREMLRWAQISNKRVYDEVFVKYGRSLKPDLIVAQWNHLSNFSQIRGDERCLLPVDLWGRDEDYLWYSMGASGHYSDLENRYLGEGTLQARYIRGTFDDKPFVLGKYESTRIRTAIAELAANGGAPMGFYTRFTDPLARAEIVRYYQFLKRHDQLYRANKSHAEVALLYPRQAVHAGNVEPVTKFRELGTKMLDQHILFDVIPDDMTEEFNLRRYKSVVRTNSPNTLPVPKDPKLSHFEAPYTVRVSASRPRTAHEITLHFVNYNRHEPPKSKNGRPSAGGGIKDEKPILVEGVKASFVVPTDAIAISVEATSPEQPDGVPLKFKKTGNRIEFEMPAFLVYAIARLKVEYAP